MEYDGKSMPATAGRVSAIMKDGRTARRLLSDGRSAEKARERSARLRSIKEAKGEREYGKQVRKILRELGLHPSNKAWGRTFHVKVEKSPERKQPKREKRLNPTTLRLGARRYKAPIRDGRGRIAVFVRMRYLGQKSKGYRSGRAADHVKYIFREDGLEDPEIQLAKPMSNVGRTVEECAAFWKALEPIEEGYRANSKVQFRMTVALPYFFDAEQRRRVTQAIGDQVFGRLGLGWMAANHIPDAKGSQRNFHPHFAASMRPAEHIGDHEWAFTEEKLTEPFTPEGLLRMRAEIAAIINMECRRAGFEERYTHQSYQRRGIDAVATEHVGPERMALHDKGEPVGVVERNNARVEANEHSVALQHLSNRIAMQEKIVGLVKEAAVRAHKIAGVQKLNSTVTGMRNTATRLNAAHGKMQGLRGIIDAGHQLHEIRKHAAQLQAAKSAKIHRSGARAPLDSMMSKLHRAVRAGSPKPGQLDQTARQKLSVLMASFRNRRPVQPNRVSELAYDAIRLVAEQANKLRQVRNGASIRTVVRGTKLDVRSILRSRGSSGLSVTKPLSLRLAAVERLHRIQKLANGGLRKQQPVTAGRATPYAVANITSSAVAIRNEDAPKRVAAPVVASLAGISASARGLVQKTWPRKMSRSSAARLASIRSQAQILQTSRHFVPHSYDAGLDQIQSIRASVFARPVSDSGEPAQSSRPLGPCDVASPAAARELKPTGAVAAGGQTEIAPSVRSFTEGTDAPARIGNTDDPFRSEWRNGEANGAHAVNAATGTNADEKQTGSAGPTNIPKPEAAAPDAASSSGDAGRASPTRYELSGLGPQHIVALLAGERFAVEEPHRGMFVPLTPVFEKHGLDWGAILHPAVQSSMAERLAQQREQERILTPLLARYVREEDIGDDDSIIARMPDEERRRCAEKWRATGLLRILTQRIRSDQRRQTEKLYRKWRAAKDANLPEHQKCAGDASAQYKRWPIQLPPDDVVLMERDAAVHRRRLAQLQGQQRSIGD
nr:MobA/MobL family protein [Pontixanthobacter rizhaonensis]